MASQSSRSARPTTAPASSPASALSRRELLRRGMAAAGGASLAGGEALAAQTVDRTRTPSSSGQRFRAYVRRGTGASLQELRLRPISPRQVVIRSEAA